MATGEEWNGVSRSVEKLRSESIGGCRKNIPETVWGYSLPPPSQKGFMTLKQFNKSLGKIWNGEFESAVGKCPRCKKFICLTLINGKYYTSKAKIAKGFTK